MRDGQLYLMQAANAKRNALLFSQWEFLNNRMTAFERVLFKSSLLERIAYFFFPNKMLEIVDSLTHNLQMEGKRKLEEAASKKKIVIAGANGDVPL